MGSTAKRKDIDDQTESSASIKLEAVNPIWLDVSESERYLLLEDVETGDVLMPLIYMKAILEANYSRKLASLKNRLVLVPRESILAPHEGLLYWQWAFESPLSVKMLVRKELGEGNVSQGHLRLVLLPIVYNAMAHKRELQELPLFKAMHRAMQKSSYYPFLQLPSKQVLSEIEQEDTSARTQSLHQEQEQHPEHSVAQQSDKQGQDPAERAAEPEGQSQPTSGQEQVAALDNTARGQPADAQGHLSKEQEGSGDNQLDKSVEEHQGNDEGQGQSTEVQEQGQVPHQQEQISQAPALFLGPISLEASASKYMFVFKDQKELEAAKRQRSSTAPDDGNRAVRQILEGALEEQRMWQSSGLERLSAAVAQAEDELWGKGNGREQCTPPEATQQDASAQPCANHHGGAWGFGARSPGLSVFPDSVEAQGLHHNPHSLTRGQGVPSIGRGGFSGQDFAQDLLPPPPHYPAGHTSRPPASWHSSLLFEEPLGGPPPHQLSEAAAQLLAQLPPNTLEPWQPPPRVLSTAMQLHSPPRRQQVPLQALHGLAEARARDSRELARQQARLVNGRVGQGTAVRLPESPTDGKDAGQGVVESRMKLLEEELLDVRRSLVQLYLTVLPEASALVTDLLGSTWAPGTMLLGSLLGLLSGAIAEALNNEQETKGTGTKDHDRGLEAGGRANYPVKASLPGSSRGRASLPPPPHALYPPPHFDPEPSASRAIQPLRAAASRQLLREASPGFGQQALLGSSTLRGGSGSNLAQQAYHEAAQKEEALSLPAVKSLQLSLSAAKEREVALSQEPSLSLMQNSQLMWQAVFDSRKTAAAQEASIHASSARSQLETSLGASGVQMERGAQGQAGGQRWSPPFGDTCGGTEPLGKTRDWRRPQPIMPTRRLEGPNGGEWNSVTLGPGVWSSEWSGIPQSTEISENKGAILDLMMELSRKRGQRQ